MRHDATYLEEDEKPGFAYRFSDLYTLVRYRAGLLLAIVMAFSGLALLAALATPSMYEATTTVLIDSRDKNIVRFPDVLSGLEANTPTIESEVEILLSRSLATYVIEELQLQDNPEFNGSLGVSTSIAENLGLPTATRAPPPKTIDTLLTQTDEDMVIPEGVYHAYFARLTVARLRNTHLIEITFRSRNGESAARVANTLASVYLKQQVNAKAKAARSATGWLENRIEELRGDVNARESAVERYKAENNIVDSEGHRLGERQLARLMEQLVLARAATTTARAKYDQVAALLERGETEGTVAEVLSSNAVATLKAEYSKSTRKVAELRTRYGERHPKIREAVAEAGDARAQLLGEVKRIVANLENEFEVAKAHQESLSSQLDDQTNRTVEANSSTVRLRELEREAEASKNVYEVFLKRYRETAEQQSYQLADARVVARAAVPSIPASSKRKQIVMAGVGAGLIAALLIIIVLEMAYPRILTAAVIESRFGTRHLGALPSRGHGTEDRNWLAQAREIVASPNSPIAGAVREVRVAVDQWRYGNGPRVIVTASAGREITRTLTASNLAHQYAASGVRTLLVDADVRAQGLSNILLPRRDTGLLDVIREVKPLTEGLYTDAATGLVFLPVAASHGAGQVGGEAFVSVHFSAIVEEMKARFDVIVIDTPGVLDSADARAVAGHADQILYVHNWSSHRTRETKAALDVLRVHGPRLTGVVTSDVGHLEYETLLGRAPARFARAYRNASAPALPAA